MRKKIAYKTIVVKKRVDIFELIGSEIHDFFINN
jgi:hypothetical protein